MTTVCWIERSGCGRLGIMPRPRGGDWLKQEIADLKAQGVDIVVSALTDWEVHDLELAGEQTACNACGIDYWSFPIPDRSTPSLANGHVLLKRVRDAIDEGKSVVIHCRLGIGRSGMLCAGILVMDSVEPVNALESVTKARGMVVPDTDEQRQWLSRLREWIRTESE